MSAITEISRSSDWFVAEFGEALSFRKLWLSVVYVWNYRKSQGKGLALCQRSSADDADFGVKPGAVLSFRKWLWNLGGVLSFRKLGLVWFMPGSTGIFQEEWLALLEDDTDFVVWLGGILSFRLVEGRKEGRWWDDDRRRELAGLVDDGTGKWEEQAGTFFWKNDDSRGLVMEKRIWGLVWIRHEMMIVVWILWLLGLGICVSFLGVVARDWIWRPYMLVQECRRQGIQGFPFAPIVGQMPAIDEVSNRIFCHGQIWGRRIWIDEFGIWYWVFVFCFAVNEASHHSST